MKKTWRLRRAVDSDADGLEKCMHAAYKPYTTRIDAVDLPPLNVDYAEEVRECEVWLAEADGGLVGALILSVDGGEFKIANVAVGPGFQGNGLGRIRCASYL